MIYAEPDNLSNIIAYYDTSINKQEQIDQAIENGAISISHDQWADCINNPGKWVIVDGALAPRDPAEVLESARNLRCSILYGQWVTLINKPIEYTTVTDYAAQYECSEAEATRLTDAIPDSTITAWISTKGLVSPFLTSDKEALLTLIQDTRSSAMSYNDLLKRFVLIAAASTVEEVEAVTLTDDLGI